MLRAFACACTLMAVWSLALGVSSCSLVLDWDGYTGGVSRSDSSDELDGAKDATDPKDASDASDASDAKDSIDAPNLDAQEAETSDLGRECGPLNCGGCCNAEGFCAGGGSQLTCGTGGEACQNCMTTGQSCDQGLCSSKDSGPPPVCVVSECSQPNGIGSLCIANYEKPCCLADGTCGCQVQLPQVGKCM